MKLLLLVVALAVFFVLDATPVDEHAVAEHVIDGVTDDLNTLAKQGKKYDEVHAFFMLVQIIGEVCLRDKKETDQIRGLQMVTFIKDILLSPKVHEAFEKIIKHGEREETSVKPRVIGAENMGSPELVSDFVTMLLTRNA